MVSSLGYPLLVLVRVVLVYLLVYIVFPALLTRTDAQFNGMLDRAFAGLVHATLLTIVIVHTLVFCQLYETFSLLAAYAVFIVAWLRMRGKSAATTAGELKVNALVQLLDLSEDRNGFLQSFTRAAKERYTDWKIRQALRWGRMLRDPFIAFLPVTVLMGAAWTRLQYAIYHAAYSLSDAYEHLAWAKQLGMNVIYQDGIYPKGYHAIISAMAELSFIDPYWLVRFMGGIGTTVLVATVYYVTLRLSRSHAASLIALAVYGLVSDARFPSGLSRQEAALPQEYSLIFGLLALFFLCQFLRSHHNRFLLLFLEAVAITMLVHPYTTIYLVVWTGIVMGMHLLFRRVKLSMLARMVTYGVPMALLGAAPYLVGMLMGKKWFSAATQFVWEGIGNTPQPTAAWWTVWLTSNPFIDLALPLAAIAALSVFVRKYTGRLYVLIAASISSVMLLLYRATDLGIPQLSEQSRTGVFMAPFLAIVYGLGAIGIYRLLLPERTPVFKLWKAWLSKGTALTACLGIVIYATPPLPPPQPVEYNAAAQGYLRIKAELPVMNWTIIGPSEQYQQVVGIGWHYDLLRFIQDFTMEDARNPGFQLPIPTNHILLFIEKRSLLDQTPVEHVDIGRELEPEGPDPYKQYYRSPEQRALLEAKAWHWIEAYRQSHSGVSIFYEDEQLRIYHIEHDPPR